MNRSLLGVCSMLILSIFVSPIESANKEAEQSVDVENHLSGQTGDGDEDDRGGQVGNGVTAKNVKPQVEVDWNDVQKKNFGIRAKTLSDFCQQISALSHAGEFSAKWDLQYSYNKTTGFVQEIRISITRTIHMPQWIGKDDRKKKEQDEYDRIISALWSHELKHNSDFERETKKLKQNLESLTNVSQGECEKLKEAASASYEVLSVGYDSTSLLSPIDCQVTVRRRAFRPPLDTR